MMDVAIVSCEECLVSKNASDQILLLFQEMVTPDGLRINIALQTYDLRDLDHHAIATQVHRAKLQIVILSHLFLGKLRQASSRRKPLSLAVSRALRSKRVIAILAGVEAKEILVANEPGLSQFNEWHKLELSPAAEITRDFCQKFTEQVIKIYNVELTMSNSSNFSVFPKKVSPDQPKIVIMLNKPLESEDMVRIELARGGDISVLDNVGPTNPYTTIIRIPDSLCADKSSLLKITLFVNNQKLGTKLIKYEFQGKANEEDIIGRMTKALPGFQNLLDDHLSHVLSKNLRAGTDWSLDPNLELMNGLLVSKEDHLPTLMHFSAYYGLEKTALTLLEEGDGFEQCAVLNGRDETPLDISQANVRHVIRDYQEIDMYGKAFQFVKDLVIRNSTHPTQIFRDKCDAFANNIEDEMNDSELTQSLLSELSSCYNNGTGPMSESGDSTDILEDSTEILEAEKDFAPHETPGTRVSDVAGNGPPNSTYVNIKPAPASLVEGINSAEARKGSYPPSVPKRRNLQRELILTQINYANIDPANPFASSPEVPATPSKPAPNESKLEGYDYPPSDTYKIPPPGIRPFNPLLTPPPGHQVQTGAPGYVVMLTPDNPDTPPKPFDNFLDEILERYRPAITPASANPVLPLPLLPLTLDQTEEDLVEVMEKYKNKECSRKEMELIYEHWKSRTDVKMSYEDRKKTLSQMRNEYNRMQAKLSRDQRRPSVLGKVLQFFNTGRKKISSSGPPGTSAVPESSSVEPELPVRKLSPNPIFNNSDRISSESNSSTRTPELENSQSVLSRERQVQWINPLTRKHVVSYVDPSILRPPTAQSPQPQFEWPPPVTPAACEPINQSPHYQEPPPPRPFKPASLSSPPPLIEGTSPPRSPKPLPKKVGKAELPVEKDTPPPMPPPRTEKPSPFRQINYESRAPDGTIMFNIINNQFTQPYENSMVVSATTPQP